MPLREAMPACQHLAYLCVFFFRERGLPEAESDCRIIESARSLLNYFHLNEFDRKSFKGCHFYLDGVVIHLFVFCSY